MENETIKKLLENVEQYKAELKKCENIRDNLAIQVLDLKEQLEECKKYLNSNDNKNNGG